MRNLDDINDPRELARLCGRNEVIRVALPYVEASQERTRYREDDDETPEQEPRLRGGLDPFHVRDDGISSNPRELARLSSRHGASVELYYGHE